MTMNVQGSRQSDAVNNKVLSESKNNKTVVIKNENQIARNVTEQKIPIRVDISAEGYENYRNSISEQNSKNNSFDEVEKQKDFLLKVMPDTHYEFKISEEVGKRNKHEKNSGNFLVAYAKLYDEIEQGYEDGTRKIYVSDETSETGYRILTKNEEMEALDQSYKKVVINYEEIMVNTRKADEILKQYCKKLINIQGVRSEMANAYLEEMESKSELPPDNISKKLIEASQKYKNQYFHYRDGYLY